MSVGFKSIKMKSINSAVIGFIMEKFPAPCFDSMKRSALSTKMGKLNSKNLEVKLPCHFAAI
jgi:hypothetical protein